MKIKEHSPATKAIQEIEIGDVFRSDGDLYLRIRQSDMCSYNAVRLECGTLYRFTTVTYVTPVDHTLVVE